MLLRSASRKAYTTTNGDSIREYLFYPIRRTVTLHTRCDLSCRRRRRPKRDFRIWGRLPCERRRRSSPLVYRHLTAEEKEKEEVKALGIPFGARGTPTMPSELETTTETTTRTNRSRTTRNDTPRTHSCSRYSRDTRYSS